VSITLVSAVDPYPTDAGKKVVLAGFISYFAERYGPENVHYIKVGAPPQYDFPVNLHVVPAPTRSAVALNITTRVVTGDTSFQEAFLQSRQTAAAIHRILDEIPPGLQVYDTVRMAQYAASDQVAARQICYLDDLFSLRYHRMLRAARRYPDIRIAPLGNFAEHIPRQLQWLANNRISQRALLRAERKRILRSEERVALTFRRCLLVNDEEASVLIRRTQVPAHRVQVVPPLLATPTPPNRQYNGSPEFVFLGLLSLPHNDDGLRWFLRAVWPTVLTRRPDARLRVIGRDAHPDIPELVAQWGDSVSIEGYVPDLSGPLGRAAAVVNPLRFGSGVKLKVIEALGRGVPVVSTPVGADGIANGTGTGVLVRRQPAALAKLLCSLTDITRNARVSAEALGHFEKRYSRHAVFRAYDRVFAP